METIDLRADPPDGTIAAPRNPIIGLGMLEKRIAAPIQELAYFVLERRDPARVVSVDVIWHAQEASEVAAGPHLRHDNGLGHSYRWISTFTEPRSRSTASAGRPASSRIPACSRTGNAMRAGPRRSRRRIMSAARSAVI